MHIADKPVSKSVHGAHECWFVGCVLQRSPDFDNETRKVRLEDKGRWPELLVQLLSRYRAGAILDEQQEQLKRLWRKSHLSAVAKKLTRARVQGEWTEPKRHNIFLAGNEQVTGVLPSARILAHTHFNAPPTGAFFRLSLVPRRDEEIDIRRRVLADEPFPADRRICLQFSHFLQTLCCGDLVPDADI